jgi:HK97 gp10 family phage protein
MSDDVVTGMAELQKALDQLPAKVERNILRGALRAGAKVSLEKARAGIHSVDGDLAASLRVKTSARGGLVKATVIAGNKKAWYARLVEMGTAAHIIKAVKAAALFFNGQAIEGVRHPGAKKHPFMRPALDASPQGVLAAAAAYIRTRLTKENIDVPGPGNN